MKFFGLNRNQTYRVNLNQPVEQVTELLLGLINNSAPYLVYKKDKKLKVLPTFPVSIQRRINIIINKESLIRLEVDTENDVAIQYSIQNKFAYIKLFFYLISIIAVITMFVEWRFRWESLLGALIFIIIPNLLINWNDRIYFQEANKEFQNEITSRFPKATEE